MKKIVLLFCLTVPLFASESAPFRIEPIVAVSANRITGTAGDRWDISPTIGGGLRFPLFQSPCAVAAVMEVGEITGTDTLPEFFTLLTTISVEYEWEYRRFRCRVGGGIANLLISAEEGFEVTKPFAGESENEFGGALMVEPMIVLGRFSLGVRFQERLIGSSPERVNILSLSLISGVRW